MIRYLNTFTLNLDSNMKTEYSVEQLKNGATVVVAPQHDTRSATIFVGFPVGSRYETKRINGVSHFIEHMMFKGTKRRPKSKDITLEIDRKGAQWNAFTSKEWTVYYIKIDAEHIVDAADIIEDMVFHSLFDREEFEREKGVINEELRMYEDTPSRDVQEELELELHAGSPLAYKIGGTPKEINALTRKDMVEYRDKFYHHDKMVVGLAGAVNEEQVAQVKKLFGKGKKTGRKVKYKASKPGVSKTTVRLKYKETDQVHVALGFPALKNGDPKLPALDVLLKIMGGSMSSRLFSEVRERRGLAYVVRAIKETYADTGNVYIHAGLHTERIDEALKVIVRELKKVAAKGVSAKELADAKMAMRGGTVLALEDTANVAQFFVEQQLLLGSIKTPEQKLAAIDKVTREDVQKIAAGIFTMSKAKLAIIGPFDDAKRFEKHLK